MTPALIRELPRLEDLYEPGLQLRQGDDHVLHAVLGEVDGENIVAHDIDDLEVVGLIGCTAGRAEAIQR